MAIKRIWQWTTACIVMIGLALMTNLGFGRAALAGDYVTVDKAGKVDLYYEDVGQGRAVVFVPGWTMTTRYFDRQLEHFEISENTHFIVFDPRAHGRSTKTLEGVNYVQHAHDLKQLIDELGLKDVVLGGWSWGGITVYTYLSLFGTDNISGVVLLDQTPRPMTSGDGSWADGGIDVVKGFFDAMVADRKATVAEFIPWMYTKPITEDEAEWMLAETMMTPDIVATQLLYDGWMFDHTETIKKLDVPQLHFVREENGEAAKAFLTNNSPDADLEILGGHGMFYDHAPAFNEALDAFLAKLD